jgi:hypothetical protein
MSTQKYIWLWLWRGRAPRDIRRWLSKRAAQIAFALQTNELLLEERPSEFILASKYRIILLVEFIRHVDMFDSYDGGDCISCRRHGKIRINVCRYCGHVKDHYVMFLSEYNSDKQKMEWKYVVSKTPRLTPL